jgi:hypothetical protein
MGYDMSLSNGDDLLDKENLPEFEPDDFIYDKNIMSNSKGVIKTPKNADVNNSIYLNFDLKTLSTYIKYTSDLTKKEKDDFKISDGKYNIKKFLSERHGIKGFFFVRQKRIPSTLAQGIVVGLTTKHHGSIPILKDGDLWRTKSFLRNSRLILDTGGNIQTYNENAGDEKKQKIRVVEQALLVPDAELQEATFNSIFTSQEFTLSRQYNCKFDVDDDKNQWEYEYLTKAEEESL